ncbi:MAG: ABC transporter ATP-binding protein, partial [Stappiaceae bacterium]
RTAFMSHVLRQPIDSAGTRLGLIMTRVVNDLSAIRLWLSRGIVSIIVALTVFLTILMYFALTDPTLARALVITVLFWALFVGLLLYPLFGRIRLSRKRRGRLAINAAAILTARPSLLVLGRHGKTMRGFQRQTERLNKALVGRATYSGGLRASADLLFPVLTLGLTVGVLGTDTSAVDAADLTVLIMATGMLGVQLNALALSAEYKMASAIAFDRLNRVMRYDAFDLNEGVSPVKRPQGGVSLDASSIQIEHRSVSFSVGAGEQVLLSGLSGPETVSLTRQIGRLSEKVTGSLLLDGMDAADISRRDWWRLVTLVSNDLPLIRGTVAENASLGASTKLSDTRVVETLDAFQLDGDASEMIEAERHPPDEKTAAAIRAARAVLRQAGLIVVQDHYLVDSPSLLVPLQKLARKRGVTVLFLLGEGCTLPGVDRTLDLS